MTHVSNTRRRGIATAAGLVVGATAYLLTLLNYGTSLTRNANALGYASNFFDFQGRALLDGKLAVPAGSLGIEGFLERGQEYMYFPPFPALLRMPILSTTDEYDGRLTVVSMVLGFVLLMVMVPKLVWLVRDTLYPDLPVGRIEASSMGILIALVTGGTTLTYVAALPWVYHEVYAWAIPLSLGAMYWMLRVLQNPTRAAIAWLLLFNLGTIMTRTTGGYAVCLVTMAAAVWVLTGRAVEGRRRIGWAVLAAGVLPLAASVALNWAKFRHPYMFPLEDQVWTTFNAHRRDALAANGGTITGLQFLPTTFMAYFRLDGIRFTDYFPWITLPASPARAYNGAFVDQTYRTGSVTSFMPWLLALTALAAVYVLRPGVSHSRKLLRFPLIAGVLVPGGVMIYGYMAFRYTSEFVPGLIIGGTIGTCVLTQWLVRRRRWIAITGVSLTALLAAFSIAANMLVGYAAAATTYGGDQLAAYVALQHRLTPGSQEPLIIRSDTEPAESHTDDIWIQGDCEAIYLATGDRYEPWRLVERRADVYEVSLPKKPKVGRIKIVDIDTNKPSSIYLQTDGKGRARTVIQNETGPFPGQWFDILEPRVVRIGVLDQPELGYAEVSSNPGGWTGYVRSYDWNSEWVSRLVDIRPAAYSPDDLERLDVSVRTLPGLEPPLCRTLGEGEDEARG